jgi:hypothetical protein
MYRNFWGLARQITRDFNTCRGWLTRKAIRQRENRGKCLLERCAFPENLIALLSIGKSRLMLAGKVNLSRKSGCTAEGWKSRVMPAAKVNLRRKSGCTSTSMMTQGTTSALHCIALLRIEAMQPQNHTIKEICGYNSRNRGSARVQSKIYRFVIPPYAALITHRS